MLARGVAAAGAMTAAYALSRGRRLPDTFVLQLDLTSTALTESKSRADGSELRLHEAVGAISEAAADPRVCGLVAKLSGARLTLAQTQELGDAVSHFREAKATAAPTLAFAAEYDSAAQYLLACKFGEVVQQPGGLLRLPAVSLEIPVLGELLSRVGLRHERVGGTGDGGVGAASPSADRAPSKAQARNAEQLVSSSYEQLVRGVSEGRGLSEGQVRRLSWHSRLLPEFIFGRRSATWVSGAEAEKARLVDACMYDDAFDARVAAECGTDRPITISQYVAASQNAAAPLNRHLSTTRNALENLVVLIDTSGAPTLAKAMRSASNAYLGLGEGALSLAATVERAAFFSSSLLTSSPRDVPEGKPVPDDSPFSRDMTVLRATPRDTFTSPFSRASAVGIVTLHGRIQPQSPSQTSSDPTAVQVREVRRQLRAACDDPSVAAIVLRIDSAGGDAIASAALEREIQLLRKSRKPVVASIGSVCGGGGYLIAAAADSVVAQPASIVGGLSVHADVPDASRFVRAHRGSFASFSRGGEPTSATRPLSSRQRYELRRLADEADKEMVAHVQSSRSLSSRAMHKAGRGHAWTGEQARRLGLVDHLGGLDRACSLASAAAGMGDAWRAGEVRVRELGDEVAQSARRPLSTAGAKDLVSPLGAAAGVDSNAAAAAALAMGGAPPRPIVLCSELPPPLARGL